MMENRRAPLTPPAAAAENDPRHQEAGDHEKHVHADEAAGESGDAEVE